MSQVHTYPTTRPASIWPAFRISLHRSSCNALSVPCSYRLDGRCCHAANDGCVCPIDPQNNTPLPGALRWERDPAPTRIVERCLSHSSHQCGEGVPEAAAVQPG